MTPFQQGKKSSVSTHGGEISMSIRIVTDSACDLPESVVADYGIAVVPFHINIGHQSYLDGMELSRQEFYERLPEYDPLPTTAAPGPEMFRQVYERLAIEGATEILSIHISAKLSGVLNPASLGAQATDVVPVTVFDSRQLSLGEGFLVLTAAKAAAANCSMAEILALLEEKIPRTHVVAALDTLEFLRRSGRMSWALSRLGNLLRIKPLLKMHNGEPAVENVRTHRRATERMIQILTAIVPLEELALVHTHAPDKAEALWKQIQQLFPRDKAPLCVEVNPVIGAHIGPGAVGFACIKAREE